MHCEDCGIDIILPCQIHKEADFCDLTNFNFEVNEDFFRGETSGFGLKYLFMIDKWSPPGHHTRRAHDARTNSLRFLFHFSLVEQFYFIPKQKKSLDWLINFSECVTGNKVAVAVTRGKG